VKNEEKMTTSLYPYPSRKREQLIHLRKKSTDVWDLENPLQNSEWGDIIHYTLSLINTAADIEKIIQQLVKDGIIDKEHEKDITYKMKKILSLPEISEYFQENTVANSETEILLADSAVIRPDRVIIKGNKAIILDYKTGLNIHDSHKKQILSYAEAVENMGYTEIDKILVYVDLNKVIVLK
jgi:ATP-dependent exoDNAse (exonuclease V) beta subunit